MAKFRLIFSPTKASDLDGYLDSDQEKHIDEVDNKLRLRNWQVRARRLRERRWRVIQKSSEGDNLVTRRIRFL